MPYQQSYRFGPIYFFLLCLGCLECRLSGDTETCLSPGFSSAACPKLAGLSIPPRARGCHYGRVPSVVRVPGIVRLILAGTDGIITMVGHSE